ncbi:glycosyltransferase family 8 C-terminal domain-containing protein, partial [Arsenophonus sp.]|uniref:glycosyltransferase family 8 C-terminal domain-containing protein n=1 Tax=Arsenophonus sp. TaxID=1872640 RepID=UPI0038799B8A
YIGHTKPWHKWANPALIKPFIIAKNASPWKDIPLESATSSHLLKYQFKHALCQKNYLSAFSAYIKYLWKCMTC